VCCRGPAYTGLKLGFHWGAEKLDSLTEFSEM